MHLTDAFKHRPSAARWVNVPFIVYSAFAIVFGAHEGVEAILPWLALLPLFTGQLIFPTLAGWFLTVVAWGYMAATLIYYLYSDESVDISSILLFGVAPLILLIVCKPRVRRPAPPAEGKSVKTNGAIT